MLVQVQLQYVMVQRNGRKIIHPLLGFGEWFIVLLTKQTYLGHLYKENI
jgi:hypothetical protein